MITLHYIQYRSHFITGSQFCSLLYLATYDLDCDPVIGWFTDRQVDRSSPLAGDGGQVGGVLCGWSLGMKTLSMAWCPTRHLVNAHPSNTAPLTPRSFVWVCLSVKMCPLCLYKPLMFYLIYFCFVGFTVMLCVFVIKCVYVCERELVSVCLWVYPQ